VLTRNQNVARYREYLATAKRVGLEMATIWREIADSYRFLSEREILRETEAELARANVRVGRPRRRV
jgi:hypothetical protein